MAEHPILFSGPMVRAILEGRKSQTRRIIKPEPMVLADGRPLIDRPLHQVGDTLWVREAWRTNAMWDRLSPSMLTKVCDTSGRVSVCFEADGTCLPNSCDLSDTGKLRASIHMPRWASRISLRVTGVKVERLQDISEDDAIAEGALRLKSGRYVTNKGEQYAGLATHCARDWFCDLWTSINGQASWDANPWVVAYSFERVKQ